MHVRAAGSCSCPFFLCLLLQGMSSGQGMQSHSPVSMGSWQLGCGSFLFVSASEASDSQGVQSYNLQRGHNLHLPSAQLIHRLTNS